MNNTLAELISQKPEFYEWATGKSWEEVYNTCDRGDWLLWLFTQTNPKEVQLLTLAKARIANTVRHLMHDYRSKHAIDIAIQFGEGTATVEELQLVVDDALDALNDMETEKNVSIASSDELASKEETRALDVIYSDLTALSLETAMFASMAACFAVQSTEDESSVVSAALDTTIQDLMISAYTAGDTNAFAIMGDNEDAEYTPMNHPASKKVLAEYAHIVRQCIPLDKFIISM